eukprot:scaffold263785_cov33-Prasinocladus_malaysianus.AAC.1
MYFPHGRAKHPKKRLPAYQQEQHARQQGGKKEAEQGAEDAATGLKRTKSGRVAEDFPLDELDPIDLDSSAADITDTVPKARCAAEADAIGAA